MGEQETARRMAVMLTDGALASRLRIMAGDTARGVSTMTRALRTEFLIEAARRLDGTGVRG